MTRRRPTLRRLGAGLVLIATPVLALAGRYQPEPKWLEAVRATEPFVPYRLGVVEFKKGMSDAWREYLGDFRATLRGANFFQQADAPRLRVEIEQGYQQGRADEDGCKETAGTLALTYRFLDGEREVNRLSVITQAPVDGDSNDWDAAMAGNLKLMLLELRKAQGDAQFAGAAVGIEARIREGLGKGSNTGCLFGAVLARGFVATVEGTMAVVSGLGEVAGAALEVAASPQFQSAVNGALAEQQQQRAQQQAQAQALAAQRAQAQTQTQSSKPRDPQAPARPAAPQQAAAPVASPPPAPTLPSAAGARPVTAAAAPPPPAVAAAVKPLRFIMTISMRNLPGDTVNPLCYSNMITRPGPPGWGAPGFLPSGSGEQAREAVYSMKAAFIARCQSSSGRQVTSEGNFNFHINQSADDEQRLQSVRPRHREDVSVTM
jgi:hypothetical protein